MDLRKLLENLYGYPRQEWTDGAGDNEGGWEDDSPPAPRIRIPKISRVWLVLGATDMRKSSDTLAILVAGQLDQDRLSGHLFGFCNRKLSPSALTCRVR